MIIFPVSRFWKLKPKELLARLFWNFFEIIHVPCPYAPQVFGLIINRKPVKEAQP